ncbi:hypothetical protein ABB37_05788 [Leptomonas pyrrhocoris]|uniref:Uncharacterized protein n=1 Tax=Leptomonas pyrrhocoris TaxID=157538 RepID=A0A0N0DUR6_LEPPY|nr:hypothetical protein ABB37_05788 [Leptomonas pyrrhocoris]KPA79338.1 hypothetical protein ABB37_05788 [Leptomonas pyrrhocoris]|eukprot:XP_015657777.1 hypothetical protein ABB37_05788 [Leptomonas pyrrhocoris]
MGAECSSEVKENPKQQSPVAQREFQPVGSAVPSPVVSSFTSGSNRQSRRKCEGSLTTDEDGDEDKGSYETGCSGRHSLSGFVPTNKVTRWLKSVPPPERLTPVPEPDVWSDGEREERDWIRTEGDPIDPAAERWDAPHYVSALGIRSASEQLEAKRAKEKQRKAQAKARCQ